MKKWISLFLAALLVVGMAACSAPAAAPDAQAGQAQADQPEASGEEMVVVEAYIVQPDWSDAWDVMEARFEEQYPWIDVESVGMGASASDFISTRASVNDLPDVTQIDNNYMWQTLCDEGNIMDLTGRDVCQYIPQSYLDAYTYSGQLIGITQGAAFSTMYYNMQQLQQAGWNEPPKNWDELLRCCEDLQNAGYTPLTFAGDFPTSLWMVFELMIANEAGPQLGSGVYEAQFKDGTFDFTAYPALAERLDALRPYILPGTPSMSQEDVVAVMTDGQAAMCVAGNWCAATILDGIAQCTADASLAAASLPPFQAADEQTWISVSPETAFGITNKQTRTQKEQEAVELFFDWLFLPENFMLIQNARGTVPVLGSMTSEQIVLPEAMTSLVGEMNAAPYVSMGFNLYTAQFSDTACTALRDFFGGNETAQNVIDLMWKTEQESYFNQK